MLFAGAAQHALAQTDTHSDASEVSSSESEAPSTFPPRAKRMHGTRNWGVTIWGVSYHIDKSHEYNGQNWGAGVRRYGRPDWRWLGSSDETRLFFEVDALKNSWSGLVLPVSAGVDYKIVSLSESCSISVLASLTVAYYQNAHGKGNSNWRYGPVPAITMGCGHLRSNVVMVLSPHSGLAAIAGSWTIVF